MKTRIEAAQYAEELLDDKHTPKKKTAHHIGKMEIRLLLDFIYEGEPKHPSEHVFCKHLRNNTAEKNKRFDGE